MPKNRVALQCRFACRGRLPPPPGLLETFNAFGLSPSRVPIFAATRSVAGVDCFDCGFVDVNDVFTGVDLRIEEVTALPTDFPILLLDT